MQGVNPAVTAFPAFTPGETVFPVLRHGQRFVDNFMLSSCGSTPLAPALWGVMNELLKVKEGRRLILIITDGAPDSAAAARSAIEHSRRIGIEVYGIGIFLPIIEELLGPTCGRVITRLEDLAPAMFEILQNALLTGERK